MNKSAKPVATALHAAFKAYNDTFWAQPKDDWGPLTRGKYEAVRAILYKLLNDFTVKNR